jgi:hypothetical protein
MDNFPLSATMIRQYREGLLQFSSRFTVWATDPVAVAANAMVLQEWLDAADCPDDKRDRFAALQRADSNRDHKRWPDNDPAKFIAESEIYYTFLKAA